jgi:tetratricopeptide (TPR) repeat protein
VEREHAFHKTPCDFSSLSLEDQWISTSTPEGLSKLEATIARDIALSVGMLIGSMKEYDQAAEIFTTLIQSKPESHPLLFLAFFHLLREDWLSAHRALEQLQQLNPSDAESWYCAGISSVAIGDYPLGIYMLEKAASLDKQNSLSNALLYLVLSSAYKGVWETEKALVLLERALKFAPKDLFLRYSLAKTLSDMNATYRASQVFQKVIELDADFTEAYYELGMIYIRQNNREKGVALLKESIERLVNLQKKRDRRRYFRI